MEKLKYKRVLVKISGEALIGKREYGIDPETASEIADQIIELKKAGAEISIIIGGGNIFRGYTASVNGMERTTADYIGMLATIMNGLALQAALEKKGDNVRLMTAITVPAVAEPYIRRKAVHHLEQGFTVIFAGGTGNPYFSTDTAAALRALETDSELLIKATKVDGVYDKDPQEHKDAKKFDEINHFDVLYQKLKVMDSTATSLCMDNNIPMIVLNLIDKGSIMKAICGEKVGTIIR